MLLVYASLRVQVQGLETSVYHVLASVTDIRMFSYFA